MGWLLLIVILALGGYALYSFFMQGESADDREVWWMPGRESGPFYWRKRWMGELRAKNEAAISEERAKRLVEEATSIIQDEYDQVANIRVKQKQSDWDDVETMYDVRTLFVKETNLGDHRAGIEVVGNNPETYSLTHEQFEQILAIIRKGEQYA